MARVAARAAEKAIVVLLDRKGFDSWWEELDDDIRQEIMDTMITEIDTVIDG